MGRISHNGTLCIDNLNRMGKVDRVKWVGLHCCHFEEDLRPKRVIQSKNILVIAMQSDPLHSDRQTDRHADRQTHRQRDRHRQINRRMDI